MVDTRIQTDLVHDRNACVDDLLFQLLHGVRDVTSCDYILLLADRRLDDCGMESIGNQGNDQVTLFDGSVKVGILRDVQRNRFGVLDAFAELLCAVECSACYIPLVSVTAHGKF